MELVILGQFDHISRFITLSIITNSSAHRVISFSNLFSHQISGIVCFIESEKFVTEVSIWRVADLQSLAGSGRESTEGVTRIRCGSFNLVLQKIENENKNKKLKTKTNFNAENRLVSKVRKCIKENKLLKNQKDWW